MEQGLGSEAALGARSEAFVDRGEPEPVSTVGWHLAPEGLCGTRSCDAWRPVSAQEVTAPRAPAQRFHRRLLPAVRRPPVPGLQVNCFYLTVTEA